MKMTEIQIASKKKLKNIVKNRKNCIPCRITNGMALRSDSFVTFDLTDIGDIPSNIVVCFRNIHGNGLIYINIDNNNKAYRIVNNQRIELPYVNSLRISRGKDSIGEVSITYIGALYNKGFDSVNNDKIEHEELKTEPSENLSILDTTFDKRENEIINAQKQVINKLTSSAESRFRNRINYIEVTENKREKMRAANRKLFTNSKDKTINFNQLRSNSHNLSNIDEDLKFLLFFGGYEWNNKDHEMFFNMMRVYDIFVLSSADPEEYNNLDLLIDKAFYIVCDNKRYDTLINNISELNLSKVLNLKGINCKDCIDRVLLASVKADKIDIHKLLKKKGNKIIAKERKDDEDEEIMDVKFKIVIPAYNSQRWIRKTLDSVVCQKYKNYDVCIVDDLSTDKDQRKIIKEYCDKYNSDKNVWKYIFNNKRKGALFNIVNAIRHSNCEDEDVIVTLDGDDWLYDDKVLNKVRNEYVKGDILLTYGQYISFPSKTPGHCKAYHPRIIKNRAYRKDEWRMSHLRTFKYKLFSRIKESDFIDPRKNRYFEMAWDLALMFPMAEMAGHRIKFISDYLYVYNRQNPINDDKVNVGLQGSTNGLLRKKQKYNYVDFSKEKNLPTPNPPKKEKMVVQKNDKLYTKKEEIVEKKQKIRTSISDNQRYPDFCKLASKNDKAFSSFRREPIYVETLEHVDYSTGLRYVKKILKSKNDLIFKNINQYRTNDDYGSPVIKNYGPGIGKICPTTIRYVSVFNDIITKFGDLSNYSIVEVGAGYGGQCKIIHNTFNLQNYTIIDLDEAMMLIKKYLSLYNINPNFKSAHNLDEVKSDLFISNYAFSECTREFQNLYMDKLIKNSKNGFMLCNFVSNRFKIKSFTLNELVNTISGFGRKVFVEDEDPKTFKGNKLVWWKS